MLLCCFKIGRTRSRRAMGRRVIVSTVNDGPAIGNNPHEPLFGFEPQDATTGRLCRQAGGVFVLLLFLIHYLWLLVAYDLGQSPPVSFLIPRSGRAGDKGGGGLLGDRGRDATALTATAERWGEIPDDDLISSATDQNLEQMPSKLKPLRGVGIHRKEAANNKSGARRGATQFLSMKGRNHSQPPAVTGAVAISKKAKTISDDNASGDYKEHATAHINSPFRSSPTSNSTPSFIVASSGAKGNCVLPRQNESAWDVCATEQFQLSDNAWISFASSVSYFPGLFSLYGSLKRKRPGFSTEHGEDFVVLVMCGVATTHELLGLCRVGMRVLQICEKIEESTTEGAIIPDGSSTYGDAIVTRRGHEQQQAATRRLPKLNVFRVACLYKRIVFVDADMVFLKDPGDLMQIGSTSPFQASQGQVEGRFNSGLFVHDYDGGITWAKMKQEMAMLGNCKSSGCKYWDRMSKRVDDQGFLNGFFDGNHAPKWKKLGEKPYHYNAKLLFYVLGRSWGVSSRATPLDRSKVVALHWIGGFKPWQPAANYPCGNTKKYCFCLRRERQHYIQMFDLWWDDYQIGNMIGLDFDLVMLKLGRPAARRYARTAGDQALIATMRTTHLKSQARLCPQANTKWTMPGQLGPSKMATQRALQR